MVGLDASIDDVGACSLASRAVVDIIGAPCRAVTDTAEAPRSATLSSVGLELHNRILLDVVDLEVICVSFGAETPTTLSADKTYIRVVTESLELLLVKRT